MFLATVISGDNVVLLTTVAVAAVIEAVMVSVVIVVVASLRISHYVVASDCLLSDAATIVAIVVVAATPLPISQIRYSSSGCAMVDVRVCVCRLIRWLIFSFHFDFFWHSLLSILYSSFRFAPSLALVRIHRSLALSMGTQAQQRTD